MIHANDNEELIEQNNKAAKAAIDEPPVPLELLAGGMGKVITVNKMAMMLNMTKQAMRDRILQLEQYIDDERARTIDLPFKYKIVKPVRDDRE